MSNPIAYTYEADIHCPRCALVRFGRGPNGFIAEDSEDDEGNPVGVIAPWDETSEEGEWCGTCGMDIADPWDDHEYLIELVEKEMLEEELLAFDEDLLEEEWEAGR